MKRYNPPLEVRTAHDVRKLAACHLCNGMGDKRDMVDEGADQSHGRCFIAKHGMTGFLALPKEQTDKLRMSDIGDVAMKALLDRDTGEA